MVSDANDKVLQRLWMKQKKKVRQGSFSDPILAKQELKE